MLARLATLLALALIVEMVGLPQPLTGPLVNMFLFLAVSLLNMKAAILVGLFTPLVALWRGQLPAILAPMIPFIIGGNSLLILVYGSLCLYFKRKFTRKITGLTMIYEFIPVTLAALGKFIFLFFAARFIFPLMFGKTFPEQILWMMAFPQFITAFIGGILALTVVKFLIRIGMTAQCPGNTNAE